MRVEDGGYSSRLLSRTAGPGIRVRVLGVLRWQRALDAALSKPMKRPIERLDPEVRAVARLGVFEAAILGVPPAVATDGAIHLVRRLGCGSASGLVNAVLRKAIAGWPAVEGAEPPVRLSHPDWIWTRWSAAFGAQAAEAAMSAAQEPAAVWVWWTHDEAQARVGGADWELVRHPWCPGAWSVPGHSAELVRAVEAGEAYAQDPSSQLVAHVAHGLAGPSSILVDLCAAPGGKAALWRRLGGRAAPLALDRHLGRLRMVRPLLESVGGGLAAVADATMPPLQPGTCELVLADAPCSGTGTLRRHPELKWRLSTAAIGDLATVQAGIIEAGLELLTPEGILLYSTCSVEPEENEDLFERTPVGFEPVDLTDHLPPGVPWIATPAGGIRILPGSDCDGFTMHAVRRNSRQ